MEIHPRIESSGRKMLIGKRMEMSLTNYRVSELWKSFIQNRKKIKNNITDNLISMSIYPSKYFDNFNPNNSFEKWAVIEISDFYNIPSEMDTIILEDGPYAVFDYKGLNTDYSFFNYIFKVWLPSSPYLLDDRPHFEILTKKYKNNDPLSEEEIWIPIKRKVAISV